MISDSDLNVCRMQGEIFEKSLEVLECGSATFIRNFMNSNIASHIDKYEIGFETLNINQIYDEYIKQYGNKKYGVRKYTNKALYWIGYTYRLWNRLYKKSSKSIYKTINGSEMNSLYLPYHTLSPEKAVQRIIEAKDQDDSDDKLYKAMKKIITK